MPIGLLLLNSNRLSVRFIVCVYQVCEKSEFKSFANATTLAFAPIAGVEVCKLKSIWITPGAMSSAVKVLLEQQRGFNYFVIGPVTPPAVQIRPKFSLSKFLVRLRLVP